MYLWESVAGKTALGLKKPIGTEAQGQKGSSQQQGPQPRPVSGGFQPHSVGAFKSQALTGVSGQLSAGQDLCNSKTF